MNVCWCLSSFYFNIISHPRTYKASYTLQQQLDELTDPDDNVAAKMLSYNRANREVAVLCNHQVIFNLIYFPSTTRSISRDISKL